MRSAEIRISSLTGACVLAAMAAGCATSPVPGAAGGPEPPFRDCPDCPEMIRIPAGEFTMGAEDGEPGRPEGPPRRVAIARDFALARYETTHAQFERFVAATGHRTTSGCRIWAGSEWRNVGQADWRDPGYGRSPQPDEPVGCVSWNDAQAYAAWLSAVTGARYRLPSEAEWEYAARAGTATPWFWGDDPDDACRHANVYDLTAAKELTFPWEPARCEDGAVRVAPVGRFAPNGFGLHDMLGNVWEWTADCYVVPYPAEPDDGSPVQSAAQACERRSVRGGSWITRISRNRVTFRGRDPADAVLSYFGFRVARDLHGD